MNANNDSILLSIKKLLGIESTVTVFDADIILHINSVFSNLTSMGVGPEDGFSISDSTPVWSDFISDSQKLQNVKSYVYLKVRILFDPPMSSIVMNAFMEQCKELEFRLFVETDNNKVN